MKCYQLLLSLFIIALRLNAQVPGCTDPLAVNYDSSANVNDGSCLYPEVTIDPSFSFTLSQKIHETSGLIHFNNWLWTHNDDTDIHIYALDTASGEIIQSFPLTGTVNNDWEEISQDDDYIYISDFGNNANGNRTDLKILRVRKNSLLANEPLIDTIAFTYADQTDFTPTGPNNTNFDCEAFIVTPDSIYVFTKQWLDFQTSVYSLPKTPGTHVANFIRSFNVDGLVTGSVYLKDHELIAICGYSSNLFQPFIYLLYDFQGTDFFGGNKRKIPLTLLAHQIEAITTIDGLTYYLTNEQVSHPMINIPPQLHIFDLSPFLGSYLTRGTNTSAGQTESCQSIRVFPIPSGNHIRIECSESFMGGAFILRIMNSLGQLVYSKAINQLHSSHDLSELGGKGVYHLQIMDSGNKTVLKRKVLLQ